jgi:hypothetical protein
MDVTMLLIYLDQNKWIDLAKAAAGRADGQRYIPALAAANDAVRAAKAVFPLSSVHIIETAKSPRAEQRQQLAALMTSLSRGVVLRAAAQIVPFYVDRALAECFGKKLETPPPSLTSRRIEDAFNFDLGTLLGISPERAQLLRRTLDTPVAWIDLLEHNEEAARKAATQAVNNTGVRYAEGNENWRSVLANDSLDTIRRAYAATLTLTLYEQLTMSLNALGHTMQEWGSLGTERLMEFWTSIPALAVELELHAQKHHEKSSSWRPNDSLDIGALSLAIPACDVVITERFWASLVRKRAIDRIHGTRVESDLNEIIDVLDEAKS